MCFGISTSADEDMWKQKSTWFSESIIDTCNFYFLCSGEGSTTESSPLIHL